MNAEYVVIEEREKDGFIIVMSKPTSKKEAQSYRKTFDKSTMPGKTTFRVVETTYVLEKPDSDVLGKEYIDTSLEKVGIWERSRKRHSGESYSADDTGPGGHIRDGTGPHGAGMGPGGGLGVAIREGEQYSADTGPGGHIRDGTGPHGIGMGPGGGLGVAVREGEQYSADSDKTVKIEEKGNGFPDIGETIYDSRTNSLYEVVSIDSDILTKQGMANYIYATVKDAGDPTDMTDEEFNDIRPVGIEFIEDDKEDEDEDDLYSLEERERAREQDENESDSYSTDTTPSTKEKEFAKEQIARGMTHIIILPDDMGKPLYTSSFKGATEMVKEYGKGARVMEIKDYLAGEKYSAPGARTLLLIGGIVAGIGVLAVAGFVIAKKLGGGGNKGIKTLGLAQGVEPGQNARCRMIQKIVEHAMQYYPVYKTSADDTRASSCIRCLKTNHRADYDFWSSLRAPHTCGNEGHMNAEYNKGGKKIEARLGCNPYLKFGESQYMQTGGQFNPDASGIDHNLGMNRQDFDQYGNVACLGALYLAAEEFKNRCGGQPFPTSNV